MQRQILVPLDGSALSEAILPHAAILAHLTCSEIALLQAYPRPVLVEPIAGAMISQASTWEIWDDQLTGARDYLAKVARKLQLLGLTVHTHVLEDEAEAAIISFARQNPSVSLIAMATHGRTGLSRLVFGSIAEKVLHASPKPLLLVHPQRGDHVAELPSTPDQYPVYRKIVVPLDGSPFAEQALGWAQALAVASEATLLLTSVVSGPEEPALTDETLGPRWTKAALEAGVDGMACYLLNTAERLRASGLKVETQIAQGHPAEMILQTSTHKHADLIVMSTHGRSGLERLLIGSVAQKVVQGSVLPILLLRPKEHQK